MNKLNDMQDLTEKWKQKKNEKGVLQLTGQQVTMILPFADCDCIVAVGVLSFAPLGSLPCVVVSVKVRDYKKD